MNTVTIAPIVRFRRIIGLCLLCYWLLLFLATHARLAFLAVLPHNSDKGLHFLAYAGLTYLLVLWLSTSKSVLMRCIGVAAGTAAVYGMMDELSQRCLTYRTCDVYDFLADSVGITLGVVLFLVTRLAFDRLWLPQPAPAEE